MIPNTSHLYHDQNIMKKQKHVLEKELRYEAMARGPLFVRHLLITRQKHLDIYSNVPIPLYIIVFLNVLFAYFFIRHYVRNRPSKIFGLFK